MQRGDGKRKDEEEDRSGSDLRVELASGGKKKWQSPLSFEGEEERGLGRTFSDL